MWRIIDGELSLKECTVYCYAPEEDPYDGEEGAIWSFDYFFFNKVRKRVCHVYLRGLSILSHSPALRTPVKSKRSADGEWGLDEPSSSKRARYWLGDRAVDVNDETDDDNELPEGWSVENSGPTTSKSQEKTNEAKGEKGEKGEEIADEMQSATDDGSLSPKSNRSHSKSTVRGMSEDIAMSMEV